MGSQEGICAERIEEMVRRSEAGTQTIGHQRLLCSKREDRARKGFVCQGQGHPRQVRLAAVNSVNCAIGPGECNASPEAGEGHCGLKLTCCARVDVPHDTSARA